MPSVMFLKSGRCRLIITLSGFNFTQYGLDIFTPLLSVITVK